MGNEQEDTSSSPESAEAEGQAAQDATTQPTLSSDDLIKVARIDFARRSKAGGPCRGALRTLSVYDIAVQTKHAIAWEHYRRSREFQVYESFVFEPNSLKAAGKLSANLCLSFFGDLI